MDEMNNDKICEDNTTQNIYLAWSAQIGQNTCDIIEKCPLLQVSVVRGGRQWSCSASSHNRVVGRSKNLEGEGWEAKILLLFLSKFGWRVTIAPLTASSESPAKSAESKWDEHFIKPLIPAKIWWEYWTGGRLPPGLDGPAQPAKSTWVELDLGWTL